MHKKEAEFWINVRLVLAFLGLEPTVENYKLYSKKHGSDIPIDWKAFANFIRRPTKTVICNVFDRNGGLLLNNEDKPVEVALDVDRQYCSNINSFLETQGKQFVRFWP